MYNILFTNQAVDPIAKAPIQVAVGTTDSTSTDLTLTGKGAANYGALQQQNLIHLLENFADFTAPSDPTIGQIWYDATAQLLKVLIQKSPSVIWKSLGGVQITEVGGVPPLPAALGDIWFERTGSGSGILYVYTGLGRYPTTATTIGGWDQIWPTVQTFAGRDEYDTMRGLVEQLAGESVSTFGSGAITRSIQNLTDFGALDLDFRSKFHALSPLDLNVLNSSASDLEITNQATSKTLFYFNDSSTPHDGYISGADAFGVPTIGQNGSILVDGVPAVVTSGVMAGQFSEESYILWDPLFALAQANKFFPARQLSDGTWQYDNNAAWVTFVPVSSQLIIGIISHYGFDDNNVYPGNKFASVWAHAVPIVGTKVEHLKVEPNSQDWDALLACAKYSMNRLDVPRNFLSAVSSMPFVYDGRPANSTLLGFPTNDLRYPSAPRRSNRKIGSVTQVQNFAETVSALTVGIENRFSLKGINGATGSNPAFGPNTAIALHVNSSSPGASGLSGIPTTGIGSVKFLLNFAGMHQLNQFLGSGGGLQAELTHTGGANPGDTAFRAMITDIGRIRITADRVRFFGSSLPLTMSRSSVPVGLWNANTLGVTLATGTSSGNTISVKAKRISNSSLELEVSFVVSPSPLAGTTSFVFNVIRDTEMNGPNAVFSTVLPWVNGNLTGGLAVAPPPVVAPTLTMSNATTLAANGGVLIGSFTGSSIVWSATRNGNPASVAPAGELFTSGNFLYVNSTFVGLSNNGDVYAVTATNGGGFASSSATLTVTPRTFNITAISPTFTIGVLAPITYIGQSSTVNDAAILSGTVIVGSVPPGLTFSTSGGTGGKLSGTPSTAGTFNFSIEYFPYGDQTNIASTTKTYSVVVNP